MTSLQPLTGGSFNTGNDNNSNLLLLQASPVVVHNNGQGMTHNNLQNNSHSDSISSPLVSHDHNNMSHINGYQVKM